MNLFKQIIALLLITTQVFPAAAIFSGSDVKILKPNLDFNGQSKILSGTVDPTSSATSAPIGSIYLNSSNGRTYRKLDAGSSTNWVAVSSGGDAGVNYVTNPDAEANTTGWSTYADAAGTSPVDCTGGSPTATWTRSTTSPLRGTANFLFTKDAANRQGEGVSTLLAVDRGDQAKPLAISFDYEVGSGTFSAGSDTTDSDIEVYLYDVTNSQLIQPAGYKLVGGSTGQFKFAGEFQTASNSQSYRLCLHQAKTGTTAYTLKVDSVKVGPNAQIIGAPVTDWQAYTPTGNMTTNATYSGFYRRVGDSVEVQAKIAFAGATDSTTMSISLPTGLVIDTAKVFSGQSQALGTANLGDNSAGFGYTGVVAVNTTSQVLFWGYNTGTWSNTVPFTIAASDALQVIFKVPVVGWGSTVTLSSDTDTRVVSASYYANANFTSNTTTPADFNTKVFDTHNAVTTGAAWKFTAPIAGYYHVSFGISTNPTSTGAIRPFVIYKNGAVAAYIASGEAATSTVISGSHTIQLNAGDYLDVRGTSSTTYGGGTVGTLAASTISIERLSGPATIAASESVIASYYSTSTDTMDNATVEIVDMNNKDIDTHGAVTTGSSWRFTAPVSGKYDFSAQVRLQSSTGWTVNEFCELYLYKNGSVYATSIVYSQDTAASSWTMFVTTNGIVPLIAGDYVDIRIRQDSGGNLNLSGNAERISRVTIKRVGN